MPDFTNGSFESPAVATFTSTVPTGWTGTGNVRHANNANTTYVGTTPVGSQFVVLQQNASIEQTLNFDGAPWEIFVTMRRRNDTDGNNSHPFRIYVDGVEVYYSDNFRDTYPAQRFNRISVRIQPAAGDRVIRFETQLAAGLDRSTFIDNVRCTRGITTIDNSGFETPVVAAATWNPNDGSWVYSGTGNAATTAHAGITKSGQSFAGTATTGFDGTQWAYLNLGSSFIEQRFIAHDTNMTLRYRARYRSGNKTATVPVNIHVNGTLGDTFAPGSTSWVQRDVVIPASQIVIGNAYIVRFTNGVNNSLDNVIHIDSIQILTNFQELARPNNLLILNASGFNTQTHNETNRPNNVLVLNATMAAGATIQEPDRGGLLLALTGNTTQSVNYNETNLAGTLLVATGATDTVGTTYSEPNRGSNLLTFNGIATETVTHFDRNKPVTLLAQTGNTTQTQAYSETSRATTLLALTGRTDTRQHRDNTAVGLATLTGSTSGGAYIETTGTLAKALTGSANTVTASEPRAQVVKALTGATSSATLQTQQTANSLLSLTGRTDVVGRVDTQTGTLLSAKTTPPGNTVAYSETGRATIARAVTGVGTELVSAHASTGTIAFALTGRTDTVSRNDVNRVGATVLVLNAAQSAATLTPASGGVIIQTQNAITGTDTVNRRDLNRNITLLALTVANNTSVRNDTQKPIVALVAALRAGNDTLVAQESVGAVGAIQTGLGGIGEIGGVTDIVGTTGRAVIGVSEQYVARDSTGTTAKVPVVTNDHSYAAEQGRGVLLASQVNLVGFGESVAYGEVGRGLIANSATAGSDSVVFQTTGLASANIAVVSGSSDNQAFVDHTSNPSVITNVAIDDESYTASTNRGTTATVFSAVVDTQFHSDTNATPGLIRASVVTRDTIQTTEPVVGQILVSVTGAQTSVILSQATNGTTVNVVTTVGYQRSVFNETLNGNEPFVTHSVTTTTTLAPAATGNTALVLVGGQDNINRSDSGGTIVSVQSALAQQDSVGRSDVLRGVTVQAQNGLVGRDTTFLSEPNIGQLLTALTGSQSSVNLTPATSGSLIIVITGASSSSVLPVVNTGFDIRSLTGSTNTVNRNDAYTGVQLLVSAVLKSDTVVVNDTGKPESLFVLIGSTDGSLWKDTPVPNPLVITSAGGTDNQSFVDNTSGTMVLVEAGEQSTSFGSGSTGSIGIIHSGVSDTLSAADTVGSVVSTTFARVSDTTSRQDTLRGVVSLVTTPGVLPDVAGYNDTLATVANSVLAISDTLYSTEPTGFVLSAVSGSEVVPITAFAVTGTHIAIVSANHHEFYSAQESERGTVLSALTGATATADIPIAETGMDLVTITDTHDQANLSETGLPLSNIQTITGVTSASSLNPVSVGLSALVITANTGDSFVSDESERGISVVAVAAVQGEVFTPFESARELGIVRVDTGATDTVVVRDTNLSIPIITITDIIDNQSFSDEEGVTGLVVISVDDVSSYAEEDIPSATLMAVIGLEDETTGKDETFNGSIAKARTVARDTLSRNETLRLASTLKAVTGSTTTSVMNAGAFGTTIISISEALSTTIANETALSHNILVDSAGYDGLVYSEVVTNGVLVSAEIETDDKAGRAELLRGVVVISQDFAESFAALSPEDTGIEVLFVAYAGDVVHQWEGDTGIILPVEDGLLDGQAFAPVYTGTDVMAIVDGFVGPTTLLPVIGQTLRVYMIVRDTRRGPQADDTHEHTGEFSHHRGDSPRYGRRGDDERSYKRSDGEETLNDSPRRCGRRGESY
jgi:hypothetical protein